MPMLDTDWQALHADFEAQLDSYMEEWEASVREHFGGTVAEHKDALGHGSDTRGGDGGASYTPHPAVDRAQSILSAAGQLPAHLASKAKDFAIAKFHKFEARYGRAGAIAVMSASVALTPIPLPGTSLAPLLIAEGVLHLSKLWHGKPVAEALREGTDEDLVAGVREFLADAYAEAGEAVPDLSDEDIRKALQ